MNGRMVQIVASGQWDLLLPANPNRRYAMVSNDTGGITEYWWGTDTPASLTGIATNTTTPYVEFSAAKIGALIEQPLYVRGVATKTVTGVEGFV